MPPKQDPNQFAPKSMEQANDYSERMKKAVEMFNTKFKDLLAEVETETQVAFNLGLERENPYAIIPTFIPRSTKVYEEVTKPSDGNASDGGTPEGEPSAA